MRSKTWTNRKRKTSAVDKDDSAVTGEVEAVRISETQVAAALVPPETHTAVNLVPQEQETEVQSIRHQPKLKRKKQKQKRQVDEEIEENREPVSGDDCEVFSDDDLDEPDENDDDIRETCNVGVNEHDDAPLQEENCDNIEAEFGEDAREEEDGIDDEAGSGDDIWDDDMIPDPLEHSDDEGLPEDKGGARPQNNGGANRQYEAPEDILWLGKTFNCPEDFKIALLRYSLKTRYDIRLFRSQSLKIGAKCSNIESKCSWKCYCSYNKRKHKMQVRTFIGKHTCIRSGSSRMLKQGTIAWLYSERLRKSPKITKKEMADEIQREFNLTVTENQCAKAKTIVMKERKATHQEHFSRVWDYQAEILRSNPGSTFEIETVPGTTIGSLQRFFRLFICFKSQRDSWKQSCRPIIGIDGAFLKWDVKGHLLAATGRDGDNRIVPIAWAIVEIENDDNWDWFVRKLSATLNLQDGRNVAIISDKQSGLVKAIHTVIPQAEHRQCAKHIMDNWKRTSHDMELQRHFWKIARSYTEGEFAVHMQALQSYNPSAHASLLKTNPRTWSRAFFRVGSCCNDNLNNLSESFNKTIRLARRKPLLDMLEDIRRQCMVRNEKRYVAAGRLKTRFTKRAHIEIEKMIVGSQFCERWTARHNKHEVRLRDDIFSVDMNAGTCGCRKWQMTGIPCVHAAAVIIGQKKKVKDYVRDWYTTKLWQRTYRDGIAPVQGMRLWPRVNRLGVLPPPWRRRNPGRPSNHDRRKSMFETSSSSNNTTLSRVHRVMTCSNCKEEGHNKQGCKNQRAATPPKRPRGRPRKVQEPGNILFGQGAQSEVISQGEPSQGVSQGAASQGSQRSSQRTQGQGHGHGSQGQGLEGWGSWFGCSN